MQDPGAVTIAARMFALYSDIQRQLSVLSGFAFGFVDYFHPLAPILRI